jgi:hypothetical protein
VEFSWKKKLRNPTTGGLRAEIWSQHTSSRVQDLRRAAAEDQGRRSLLQRCWNEARRRICHNATNPTRIVLALGNSLSFCPPVSFPLLAPFFLRSRHFYKTLYSGFVSLSAGSEPFLNNHQLCTCSRNSQYFIE